MRQIKSGEKINLWKWAFLLFFGIQLALVGVLWSRMVTIREQIPAVEVSDKKLVQVGTVTTNREQLNETLSVYLKDYQLENFSYTVQVTGTQVVFEGAYEILGTKIPLYVYLSPFKDENGAVVLEVAEVSAGTLSLPTSDVLNYIRKNYKFPKFIKIDAKQAQILVDLPNLSNQLNLVFKATTVDLYNDQLIFEIYRKNN